MSRKRDHIPLETKLAATLLALRDEQGRPYIPYEHAKLMTSDQIVSLFQFDHGVFHTHDGPDEAWNLTPRNIIDARIKTAEIDVPAIAKVDRLAKNETLRRAAEASKHGDYSGAATILASAPKPKFKKKIASRGFSKVHRPLRSGNTFQDRRP